MKKLLLLTLVPFIAFSQVDDDQLIDRENNEIITPEREFSMQTFDSCDDMNSILKTYLSQSIRNQIGDGSGYYGRPMPLTR